MQGNTAKAQTNEVTGRAGTTSSDCRVMNVQSRRWMGVGRGMMRTEQENVCQINETKALSNTADTAQDKDAAVTAMQLMTMYILDMAWQTSNRLTRVTLLQQENVT